MCLVIGENAFNDVFFILGFAILISSGLDALSSSDATSIFMIEGKPIQTSHKS